MVKRLLTFILLCLFMITPRLNAAPKATCDVIKTAQHDLLVTFTWKLTVQSDKDWQA